MELTFDQLQQLLHLPESEHLEFKEAKRDFSFDRLLCYGAALANEGGGTLVLGVGDRRPRKVLGSAAFQDLVKTRANLTRELQLRVEACEMDHADGRVVIFKFPPRPIGRPIRIKGVYWTRRGEELTAMTEDALHEALMEACTDFSALPCRGATDQDLSPSAIAAFRAAWHRKTDNSTIATAPVRQLLRDAELLADGVPNFAALVVMGKGESLGRLLPQVEFVYEYRSNESSISYQQRQEFRDGFLNFADTIWNLINLRNDIQQVRDGLYMSDIRTFNEVVVRECLLNAMCHRDYQSPGSVFVRQYPQRLDIVSPGGLPKGITPENIVFRQSPRNRRIAETLARCGLVERSGQGADRVFSETIREGKAVPDFANTDAQQVSISLRGEVTDPVFVHFLRRLQEMRGEALSANDYMALDLLRRNQQLPPELQQSLPRLSRCGAIEAIGRGKGTRYILAKDLYRALGNPGAYTRERGLDHETQKQLLLKHIRDNAEYGSPLRELQQVLPHVGRRSVQRLVAELRDEGFITVRGKTNTAMWLPKEDR